MGLGLLPFIATFTGTEHTELQCGEWLDFCDGSYRCAFPFHSVHTTHLYLIVLTSAWLFAITIRYHLCGWGCHSKVAQTSGDVLVCDDSGYIFVSL